MVSDGQKIKALWNDNKDVLMGMVLGSLASMPVNIYWKRRPDVTQGLIVESSFTLPSIVANGVLKNGKCHITLKAANSESGSVLASQVAGWQASATTFPSKPFSVFPRSRTPRLGGRAAHVASAARRVVRAASGPRVLLQDLYAMDESAKGQPFGEDVKERIRRTTGVPSCANGLKESSSASGSGGASQPDDGDDEEDDVDDGDGEQSLATRTTREKKAAHQVVALKAREEAREARHLPEASKVELASRAAVVKRRISCAEFRASYGCTKPALPRSRSLRLRDRDAQAAPSARRVVRDVPADGRPSSSGAYVAASAVADLKSDWGGGDRSRGLEEERGPLMSTGRILHKDPRKFCRTTQNRSCAQVLKEQYNVSRQEQAWTKRWLGKTKRHQFKIDIWKRMDCISFALTLLLRHGNAGPGQPQWYPTGDGDGSSSIEELLQHRGLQAMCATAEEICELITKAEKNRFHFFTDSGELVFQIPTTFGCLRSIRVGCGQGHNKAIAALIDYTKLWTLLEIDGPGWHDILNHGTQGYCVGDICRDGLLPGGTESGPQGRAHIHLVSGVKEVGDQAGLRTGSTHLVLVDARSYVQAGGQLYLSPQGCVLTAGIDTYNGRMLEEASIPPECILDVQPIETKKRFGPLPTVSRWLKHKRR